MLARFPNPNASHGILHFKNFLGVNRLDWDERQKIDDNYERLGIVMDPNMAFGRNANKRDPLEETMSNRDRLDHEDEIDDELKAAMSKQRSSGKALPKRPTSRQRQIIRRLTDAHGDDLDSMVLDRKLNAMQLSRGQVKNLIEACNYWEEGSSVGFRAKIKGL